MNNKLYAAKNSIIKQKKLYRIIITLMIFGIISGILFIFFISKESKTKALVSIKNFFDLMNTSTGINYGKSLLNTLVNNIGYVLLIWLLGISIIGLPITIILAFMKSFIVGFSISSIISCYKAKGILGAFLYVFPHQIIILFIYLLLSFYSISFSIKLFKSLFLKQTINFRVVMQKYIKILLISLIGIIIVSLYEVFISTYFIKLFTMLLK
ncbi:stage II sporulation protein M [Clostridium sp. CAG:710]|nr:stage II sporulation protein M [Clostridium sp. CAG:710]